MLMASYGLVNYKFSADDARFANISFKQAASGVVLYALGKWAFQKFARTVINKFTDVNIDLFYKKQVIELPELGQEKGLVRTQYPKVYDSVQFYRSDLLTKDGELNHNNAYYHDDKIVRKVGYKDKKNGPLRGTVHGKICPRGGRGEGNGRFGAHGKPVQTV